MTMHVAVLMGGWSAEREVSLVSGAAATKALKERGFRVTPIDVSRDLNTLLAALTPRPDVVFNALHGRGGEDGTVQAVFDILQLRYTHSGMLASAVAMDKAMTKQVLSTVGVRSPQGMTATREQVLSGHIMPAPYVLKPNNEGSSVGIQIVRSGDNRHPFDAESWGYGDSVLVEEYIPGRDLTVAVMGDRALTVTEIRPHTGFYDYSAKYTDGRATHIVPAEAPAEVLDEAMRVALLAHRTLGCAGVSRSDFRWNDGVPGIAGLYFLEINTQPGMTPLSLVPEQAAHLGMSFGDLVVWMVENAACHA
jgi:D-alanine-D-alanine ligase